MKHDYKSNYKLHRRRYPWDEWFSRTEPFTLHAGKDFNGRAYTMAQQFRNRASPKMYNKDVSIEVNDEENSITVWILGDRKD